MQRPRIAVVGDIMVDVDLHCRCERICQEGPWPVLSIERTEKRMGGAGNVAEMLHVLGADALLVGLVGCDDANGLPVSDYAVGWLGVDGQTTTKSRVWVNGHPTGPRIDQDLIVRPTAGQQTQLVRTIERFAPDAIVVADHGKGVVSTELMTSIGELDVPTFVDPIKSTPIPFHVESVAGGVHELGPTAGRADCVIEKRGARGIAWRQGDTSEEVPSACRQLVDPLGAGDQFIAALAFQRCRGAAWREAIEWANRAAGLQCERRGCVPVPRVEIESQLARTTQHLHGSHVAATGFPGSPRNAATIGYEAQHFPSDEAPGRNRYAPDESINVRQR